MLELFGHPFSSYTWKAPIALYENDTPFTFRMLDPDHPENAQRIQAVSPLGKFPVLIDGDRDALNVASAQPMLQCSYRWLDKYLQHNTYACGEEFTLADCAAAPSLFYAGWVDEIGKDYEILQRYRARLLTRPSIKQCVDDARPYRALFPPGAPDRD